MSGIHTRLLAGLALLTAAIAVPSVTFADWTFLPPPTVGVDGDAFTAVDGTAADDIWAVGAWSPPDWNYRCLIEHFDGVAWTKMPVPEIGSNEKLTGVVALSRDRALAIGYHTAFTRAHPLALEWDGTGWVQIPVPEPPGGSVLQGIDQTPDGTPWAVGYQAGSGFIVQRTGGNWVFEIAPPAAGLMNRFRGLHAAAPNQIWVVGSYEDGSGTFRILIRRYDGNSTWTTFDVPTPGLSDVLWDVHASAPNDVWAVGEYYHPDRFRTQPLIMHYDGTSWTQTVLPDYPEGPAHLRAIAARSPDDIYASGTYGIGASPALPRPFMLHYDGTTWSDVTLPPTNGIAEWFLGMAATPDGDLWAVGQYSDGSSMEPMAFRQSMRTTAVGDPGPGGPSLVLRSVPNPFRSGTAAHFELERSGPVRLRVLDLSGRHVRTLVRSDLGAGSHVAPWDGLDLGGHPVPAGIYFYVLETSGRTGLAKVVRMR